MATLAFVIFLFAFALVFRFTKNWGSISRIHAFIWTVFFFGYSLLGGKSLSFVGPLWIFASLIFVFVGEKIGEKVVFKRGKVSLQHPAAFPAFGNSGALSSPFFLSRIYWFLLCFFIFLSVCGGFLKMHVFGYDIRVFFNFSAFLQMNLEISKDRYSDSSIVPFYINFFVLFQYVCALFGSYSYFSAKKTSQKLICFLCYFPVIFNSLIDTTKAGLIASLFLLVCGLFTGIVYTKGDFPKVRLRSYLISGSIVAVLLIFLFLLMVNRAGGFKPDSIDYAKNKFSVYAFGEIGAFDEWLHHYYVWGSYSFGKMTFLGPFSLFGLAERKTGVYGYLPGFETNVYTSFRGIISDFGVFGGLFALGAVGFLGGFSFESMRYGIHKVFARPTYAQSLFFVAFSFVISPWTYSSFFVTFLVFLFFCFAEYYIENGTAKRLFSFAKR
jgi:oligosaccharide repeat unit polymerase